MKESKEYFADVAKNWDEMRVGYFTEKMRDDAIARINLPPGAIVADVGTGTGFMIQGLAPLVSGVYGFDESSEMLAVASRNLAGYSNVQLREAQGAVLPVPADSFDAVFGNMYLHHTIDPAASVAELARVLRPGGWLLLIDMDAHDQEWMREAMADRWLGFKRDEVRNWYTDAGLIDVNVDCANGKCCTAAPDGKNLAISIFVAYGKKIW